MQENRYIDTRGCVDQPVEFTEAVINGLADGGGLYVPQHIPELTLDEICELAQLPYAQRAARIYKAFGVDLPAQVIDELMAQAYGDNFDDERICPITSLDADTHVLELWHGPTSAFKDMALQCLPRFFSASAAQLREQGKLDHDFLILVATSGDTGKAALEGFRDLPHVSISVMYPDGGVSDIQYRQMATQRGSNVNVWGVRGNFDDCQTGAKNVFGDAAFAEKLLSEHGVSLSSANSINIARLAPQIAYYYAAYHALVREHGLANGTPVTFVVPTGNFGDILAGLYAKEMGLPVAHLVCASNANRVLTDFLVTGVYDARRTLSRTLSPSMDILVSSNLERLLFHAEAGNSRPVREYMRRLAEDGAYRVSEAALSRIQHVFRAYAYTDEDTLAVMGRAFRETGYLPDPHTAIAFAAAEAYRKENPGVPCVSLATASPFKFPQSALRALLPEREEGYITLSCTTAGGSRVLRAFYCDSVRVNGRDLGRRLVAVSPDIYGDSGFQGVWRMEEQEGAHELVQAALE